MRPYRAAPDDPAHHPAVVEMFDRIAPRYDRMNRVMTLGLDVWWRARLVWSLDPDEHPRVLDACTGTGDVALRLGKRGHRVVGVDAALLMLAAARRKPGANGVRWCAGNCLTLPFPDGAFDALTIAFGIRNIADRAGALREFGRVVRVGGMLLVLEALEPGSSAWGRIIRQYERCVIPAIGGVLARQRAAYEYLAQSIAGFGTTGEFEAELREAGWVPQRSQRLMGGSAVLFLGRKS